MRVERLDRPEALADIGADWNGLITGAVTNTVFQRCEWLTSWWNAFGAGRELAVLVVNDGGVLSAAAPLALRSARLYGLEERVLGFIGGDNFASDYCDFVVPAARGELLEPLLDRLAEMPDWTLLDLFNLPSESPNKRPVEEYFAARGWPVLSSVLYDAPTCILGDSAAAQALINRKSLKRHYNYFARGGGLECLHLTKPDEIEPWLPAFYEQHRRRWRESAGSIFDQPDQRRFYDTLVRRMEPEAGLRFTVVLHRGAAIAFHLGFDYAGRFIWYKPSFDIALKQQSPGEVLLRFLFQYAIERGLKEFDFTVGSEPFKYRFANHIRTCSRVRVYRRRLSYRLERARQAAGAAKRTVLRALE